MFSIRGGKNFTKAMELECTPFSKVYSPDGFRPGETPWCDQQCQQPREILWLRKSEQALPQPITSSQILPEVLLSSSSQMHSPVVLSVFFGPLLPNSAARALTLHFPQLLCFHFWAEAGHLVHAHVFMQVQDRTLQDLKVICLLSTQAVWMKPSKYGPLILKTWISLYLSSESFISWTDPKGFIPPISCIPLVVPRVIYIWNAFPYRILWPRPLSKTMSQLISCRQPRWYRSLVMIMKCRVPTVHHTAQRSSCKWPHWGCKARNQPKETQVGLIPKFMGLLPGDPITVSQPCREGWSADFYFKEQTIILSVGCGPWGFPGGPHGREPACRCRRHKRCGLTPGSGRSPGGGDGNPLQHSCLEDPMDWGSW